MSLKTRKVNINSIKINRELLEKLGNIVESEIRERETQKNKEYFSIKYTIKSSTEELEFSSIKEMLDTPIFPQRIQSLSIRVMHMDTKYVDIYCEFDNDFASIAQLSLSSENESNLLKFEKEIKGLFGEYKTNYNWLFKLPYSKQYVIHGIAILFAFLGVKLVTKIIRFFSIVINDSIWNLLVPATFILLFWIFYPLFKYLYPYHLFELSNTSNFRKSLKAFMWIIISGIVVSLIYDFFKLIRVI